MFKTKHQIHFLLFHLSLSGFDFYKQTNENRDMAYLFFHVEKLNKLIIGIFLLQPL